MLPILGRRHAESGVCPPGLVHASPLSFPHLMQTWVCLAHKNHWQTPETCLQIGHWHLQELSHRHGGIASKHPSSAASLGCHLLQGSSLTMFPALFACMSFVQLGTPPSFINPHFTHCSKGLLWTHHQPKPSIPFASTLRGSHSSRHTLHLTKKRHQVLFAHILTISACSQMAPASTTSLVQL